jgi:hypothetical protein
MYILTSRRRETGQVQSHHVDSQPAVYDLGLALLDRGDELIDISWDENAFPVTPEDIQTARAVRARYAAQGVIPKLEDPELMLRAPPLGHPLQKYTVVQWDMGALFGRGRWRR